MTATAEFVNEVRDDADAVALRLLEADEPASRATGVPAARRVDVDELDSATSILLDHVKVDRIPTVVRRPAAFLNGENLLDVARRNPGAASAAVAEMFDLRRVQP